MWVWCRGLVMAASGDVVVAGGLMVWVWCGCNVVAAGRWLSLGGSGGRGVLWLWWQGVCCGRGVWWLLWWADEVADRW